MTVVPETATLCNCGALSLPGNIVRGGFIPRGVEAVMPPPCDRCGGKGWYMHEGEHLR